MGHPVAAFEIDRIERPAPAAPVIGAAAQKTQPPAIQRDIRETRLAALIKLLCVGFEFQPARFQKQHASAAVSQRQRQADAGGAAADDRQVG